MACKFCPKIRKTDWIFIIVVCIAFYGIDKYQNNQLEKKQKQLQEQQLQKFEKLQKECLYGNEKACQEVYKK